LLSPNKINEVILAETFKEEVVRRKLIIGHKSRREIKTELGATDKEACRKTLETERAV
jgi:hypothetical protein